jgi:hypothetical protein
MQMPFGKHAGEEVCELPNGYLLWLARECDLYGDLLATVLRELRVRGFKSEDFESRSRRRRPASPPSAGVIHVPLAENTLFKELVDAGYHALAMRHHPDRGGDAVVMRRLISLTEEIRRQLLTTE